MPDRRLFDSGHVPDAGRTDTDSLLEPERGALFGVPGVPTPRGGLEHVTVTEDRSSTSATCPSCGTRHTIAGDKRLPAFRWLLAHLDVKHGE